MDTTQTIFAILAAIGAWILVILKLFGNKYIEKKAENTAILQDTEEITRVQESTKKYYEREHALFSKDLAFKYEFFKEQYYKLYAPLFKVICESEANRYFNNCVNSESEEKASFEKVPFVFATGEMQNKVMTVVNSIIESPELAEPDLLKKTILLNLVMECKDEERPVDVDQLICQLKKELIQLILEYHALLEQNLKINFSNPDDYYGKDVADIKNGTFIYSSQWTPEVGFAEHNE